MKESLCKNLCNLWLFFGMGIDILRTGTLLFGYKSLSELLFVVILDCEGFAPKVTFAPKV